MRKIKKRTSIMLIQQMMSTVSTMIFNAAIGACCRQVTRRCLSLSHVGLFATPWTVAHQVHLSMVFSRQEYWSGEPFPSPRDLPDPGIKPRSPALQVDSAICATRDALYKLRLSSNTSYLNSTQTGRLVIHI